jgi:hypothetical protein
VIGIDLGGKMLLISGGLGAIAEHIVRKIVAAHATSDSRSISSPQSRRLTGRKSQVENGAGLKNGRPEWTRTIDLFRVKEAL